MSQEFSDAVKIMLDEELERQDRLKKSLESPATQAFVENLLARLNARKPIVLDKPLELVNKTNGPAIVMYNDGPGKDWMGICVQDEAGNQSQLGIGPGNQEVHGIDFAPEPKQETWRDRPPLL